MFVFLFKECNIVRHSEEVVQLKCCQHRCIYSGDKGRRQWPFGEASDQSEEQHRTEHMSKRTSGHKIGF